MLPKYFLPWATKASLRLSEAEPVEPPGEADPLPEAAGALEGATALPEDAAAAEEAGALPDIGAA